MPTRRALPGPAAVATLAAVLALAGCAAPDAARSSRVGPAEATMPTPVPVPVPTPTPVVPQPALCRGTVTLTFDDGPAPGATPTLLAVLDRLHVTAAFFMVGDRVDAHPALARAVRAAGHAVGNHTYAHEDLTTLAPDAAERTLRGTERALLRAGLPWTPLVRLPYGRSDPAVAGLLRRSGWTKVGWNAPAGDGDPRAVGATATQLADRVVARLRSDRANVVLQHDGGPVATETIAAVPLIVDRARAAGYCVVGLGEDGRPLPR